MAIKFSTSEEFFIMPFHKIMKTETWSDEGQDLQVDANVSNPKALSVV